MQVIHTANTLISIIKSWKHSRSSIVFVPTMGNLHEGHLKLIEEAKKYAEKLVVSIFVNPTQFSEGEDFLDYPRTEQQDIELLQTCGVDLLFLPKSEEIYLPDAQTVVSVVQLANLHCGKSRIGHFDGVATVVCKLFNLVQPDLAFFGEKDFQQLTIIRKMVQDLNIPVQIKALPTVRDENGLAMSSRNNYLTAQQRLIAPILYQTLCQARDKVNEGIYAFQEIEQQQREVLDNTGFTVDYFSICNANTLLAARPHDKDIVILVAAKLKNTRLIDNIHFKINDLKS